MAAEIIAAYKVGEVIVSSGKILPARLGELEAICAPRGVTVGHASLRIE
jgi:hypothetical protein